MAFSLMILMRMFSAKRLLKMKVVQFLMLIFRHSRDNDGETEVGTAVVDDQEVVVDQEALVADEDGEFVVTPLFQDVVEVVVVAILVVDDLYDVVRDNVLKDLVRADVDHVVVGDVDELLVLDHLVVDAVALVDELFVVAFSDADLDVSDLVDVLVDSLSHDVLFDADLDVSHLVDVVVAYSFVVIVNLYVVVVNLYVVDELSLFVVDH